MDDGDEESPDLNEDEEMFDADMLSDHVNDIEEDEDVLDECGRFSENDAIESSGDSRPGADEGDFEDFIAAQEEDTRGGKGTAGEKSQGKVAQGRKKAAKSSQAKKVK